MLAFRLVLTFSQVAPPVLLPPEPVAPQLLLLILFASDHTRPYAPIAASQWNLVSFSGLWGALCIFPCTQASQNFFSVSRGSVTPTALFSNWCNCRGGSTGGGRGGGRLPPPPQLEHWGGIAPPTLGYNTKGYLRVQYCLYSVRVYTG